MQLVWLYFVVNGWITRLFYNWGWCAMMVPSVHPSNFTTFLSCRVSSVITTRNTILLVIWMKFRKKVVKIFISILIAKWNLMRYHRNDNHLVKLATLFNWTIYILDRHQDLFNCISGVFCLVTFGILWVVGFISFLVFTSLLDLGSARNLETTIDNLTSTQSSLNFNIFCWKRLSYRQTWALTA